MKGSQLRLRVLNSAEVNPDGEFVLYWMIAARRRHWNFALQRAVRRAKELERPLVILEALRCDYRWASDRIHRFVLQGMADNARSFSGSDASYYPYVETEVGAGRGLLKTLASRACLVVTDDFPAFFLPRMIESAASQVEVRMEAIDSNGLLPLDSSEKPFTTAFSYRAFLQKRVPEALEKAPKRDPLRGVRLPAWKAPSDLKRWPRASEELLEADEEVLARLPIDHDVKPLDLQGGASAGERLARSFVERKLGAYDEDRNHPDEGGSSGLSPYLHFGHVATHGLFELVSKHEDWSVDELSSDTGGKRSGYWGMSASAEAFLDQFLTWRELGYHFCRHVPDYDSYGSLPDWAQETLGEHAKDPREHLYDLEEFEGARTHDELWNAAQRQLVRDGTIHNYLRMLWGKKILEWTHSPQKALEIMIELNNKYALDGRNPNSYSGIFWTLGRFDRAWGPERRVFGKIRYMTSANTRRKVRLKEYLERYGEGTLFDAAADHSA